MGGQHGRSDGRWPAAVAVAVVLGVFAVVLVVRWRANLSNVDDYLYARQTREYLDALGSGPRGVVDAWRKFASNSPLVPTLALPIAAVEGSPNALVLVQALPLLVLLGSCRSLLGALGLGRAASWLVAAAITALPPVMAYAAMYHFAVAAAACTALAAAAYARSERLLALRPALLLGLALGLLSLTRVLAPVYVAAIGAVVLVDVLASAGDRVLRLRHGAWAALVAVVVAAPWWLADWRPAWHYLTSAGYGDTVFTHRASRADILAERLRWTASETGWLLAILLVVLLAGALACVVRRAPGWRLLAWLVAASVLGILLLGTSSNSGTAFALPFVVLAACAGAGAVSRLPRRPRAAVAGACAAALVAPALALVGVLPRVTVAGRPLWQERTPGVQEAWLAMGCRCRPPDSDGLSRRVLDVIGHRPTLIARDDALLNAEGLRFTALDRGWSADLRAPAGTGGGLLPSVRYVVAGTTYAPYHPRVNEIALALRLHAARFRPVANMRLSAGNTVAVWAAP